ncbi:MAG TPA: hypothetical protein VF735_18825 [Pyrinomonadaceae bacterium]|jgi:hypothetical protein
MSADESPESGTRSKQGQSAGLLALWAGVLVAPMAFLSNLQVNYTLAQKLCPGGHTSLLHLMTIIFLVIAAAGGLVAWRNWERAGRRLPDEAEDTSTRDRFLGSLGVMISALSFLIIVAQWIPQFIFNPCQR